MYEFTHEYMKEDLCPFASRGLWSVKCYFIVIDVDI